MKKSSVWTIVISLGLAIVGIILLWTSSALQSKESAIWVTALSGHAGGFLVGTASLALIWEVRVKHLFMQDLLNAVRLSSDIRSAGIAAFSFKYLDLDWQNLFGGAREIDLFFSYAQTWRNTYVEEITTLSTDRRGKIRVLLPDPDHPPLMDALALRFSSTPDEVKQRIADAVDYFKRIFSANDVGATCVLHFTRVSPEYAFYRFDDKGVVTFFNHLGRTGKVPTFEVEAGGTVFMFAQEEFNELALDARECGRTQTLSQ